MLCIKKIICIYNQLLILFKKFCLNIDDKMYSYNLNANCCLADIRKTSDVTFLIKTA